MPDLEPDHPEAEVDSEDRLPKYPGSPALEPINISALAQYAYCPRRCALILLEQDWSDNEYTLRGTRAHETVDVPEGLIRERVQVERALPLWSERLGLIGKGDVVEFVDNVPYPVEYKVGNRWAKLPDEVQLCAQAMCLEEMFGVPVSEGALFYKTTQRRRVIDLTPELRAETLTIIRAVRQLMSQDKLPAPVADNRCPNCSLLNSCMPEVPQALQKLLTLGPEGDT